MASEENPASALGKGFRASLQIAFSYGKVPLAKYARTWRTMHNDCNESEQSWAGYRKARCRSSNRRGLTPGLLTTRSRDELPRNWATEFPLVIGVTGSAYMSVVDYTYTAGE